MVINILNMQRQRNKFRRFFISSRTWRWFANVIIPFAVMFTGFALEKHYGNSRSEKVVPESRDTEMVTVAPTTPADINISLQQKLDSVVETPVSTVVRKNFRGRWKRLKDFPGQRRYMAFVFAIAGKAYMGTGARGDIFFPDFWEYDPGKDEWTRKENFPGERRRGSFSFVINDKGYVGGGNGFLKDVDNYPDTFTKDFWEYNPKENKWRKRKYLPVDYSYSSAVTFVINGKGYVVTGTDDGDYEKYRKLYEYDPETDTWTRKKDFPGKKRSDAFGFALNNKGYVGCGSYSYYTTYSDFWEYDPVTDSWTQKNDFPVKCDDALAVVINGKAYVGFGKSYIEQKSNYYSGFWEYNPDKDCWNTTASFIGDKRHNIFLFSIGNKAYIGLGYRVDNTWRYFRDMWEFTPN